MPRRFRSAYSGGWFWLTCLLTSCMRFGYEPADELDDSLGLDAGSGGTLGDGGSVGSFAGAAGANDSAGDTSETSVGAGGSTANMSAVSTATAGGTSGSAGSSSSDSGGVAGTGVAGTTSTDSGGMTSTDSGGATSMATATSTDGGGATSTGGIGGAGTGGTSTTSSATASTTTGTGGVASSSASTTTGTGGVGGGGTGGSTGTGGATGTGGSTTSATTGGGGACAPAGTTDYLASFAADLEGFGVTGAGGPTLTWNAAVGEPDLGALELNASGGGAMQVRNLTPPGDLSGRIMSVNVYVAAGTGVDIILYVQSGSPAKWADGGTVTATTGQWYCLTLDLDNPVTTSASFDPTDVRVVGVDIQGSGDLQVYIDQFAY